MEGLLQFLARLDEHKIHHSLHHYRDEFIMVKVDVPGERWEVEFSAEGEVLIEIFKNSDGVHDDKAMLEDIFFIDHGIGFSVRIVLNKGVDENQFIDDLLRTAVEPLGFAFGGNPFHEDGAFVTMYARGDVMEGQRAAFEQELQKRTEIKSFILGPLKGNKDFA